MKITPIAPQAAPGAPLPPAAPIKMRVNVTPGYVPPADAGVVGTGEGTPIPKSDKAASTEAAAAEGDTQPLSTQHVALAKAKRDLQRREQALAAKEAAAGGSPTGIDPAALKANPLKILLESGVTYQQLVEEIQKDQTNANPQIQDMKDQLKALKDELKSNFDERDNRERQQVIANITADATSLAAEGETYEMIREMKQIPSVIKLIEQNFDTTGEIMDTEEAMNLVEAELVKDALIMAGRSKVRAQLTPQQQQNQSRTTLTSRDGARTVLSPKQRALAAFLGKATR